VYGAFGTEAEFVRTDVRHEEEVKNLVDQIIARFGRLDVAVNNAGTVGNPESAADANTENYKAIFDTNVLGVLLSMKYEIRAMLRQGKGSIVNISSAYGKVRGPSAAVYVGSKHAVEGITKSASIVNVSSTFGHTGSAGASIYAASKHAVEGLTKSAALEVAGAGVRVNVVAPGPIETPMSKVRSLSSPVAQKELG
jgi:NAD(P)-dependent dehydrogenase (short-subunit alcohol dehydrogenase family)